MTPLPTSLTVRDSPCGITCVCCSKDVKAETHVVVFKQGNFQPEEESILSKLAALFRKCCCCEGKKEALEAKKERNRQTREEVKARVYNACALAHEGVASEEEVLREQAAVLQEFDPRWPQHTADGEPLSVLDFRQLGTLRSQRRREKVDTLHATNRAPRHISVEELHPLLTFLIPFVKKRGEWDQEKLLKSVRKELVKRNYNFSSNCVQMIIDHILDNPTLKIDDTTIEDFKLMFEVAQSVTAAQKGAAARV